MISKEIIKQHPALHRLIMWLITPKRNPRPRLWVKLFINPFFHKRGKGSVIRSWRSRIDVFPWHRFEVGKLTTIEDFTTINNGAGDVLLGDSVRVGIGTVIIGPVLIKSGVGIGQHVFIAGFSHGYKDQTRNWSVEPLDKKIVVIDENTQIGANSVIVAGVHIGKHVSIGAGSVVTKDIPDYSLAVGNPAKVIKQFDSTTGEWGKIQENKQ